MFFFKWVSILILFAFLFFSNISFANNTQSKLDTINSKISKNNKLLKKKEGQRKKALKGLGSINKKLSLSKYKLKKARQDLVTLKKNISKSNSELIELKKEYNIKVKQLERYLVEIYQLERVSFIEMLFSPELYWDILDSPFYFETLLNMEISLLENVKSEYDRYKKQQSYLFSQKQKLITLKLNIAKQESNLLQQQVRKKRHILSLNSQIKRLVQQNKELAITSQEITQLIIKNTKRFKQKWSGYFIKPVKGWLSSRYGRRKHPIFKRYITHRGIDFAAPRGYKIKAADSGVVIEVAHKKGYGKLTIIDHGPRKSDSKRVSTVYAHQSRILVKQGDVVLRGDVIGLVGSTGYSTGPHLHFEMRLNGVPVNPLKYVRR